MYAPSIIIILNLWFGVCVTLPWFEQIVRQELLVERCKNIEEIHDKPRYDHILVEKRHRLLYCYVPKIACTNWKRIIMILSSQINITDPLEISGNLAHSDNSTIKLSDIPTEEIEQLLESSTIFLMVRHPFERILSAFRNKFEDTYSKYFQIRYGRTIIKKYRENPSLNDLENGTNVTFDEFVKYLIDGGVFDNEHWMPLYDLCTPCKIDYNFIGRYETLQTDAAILLDYIHAPTNVTFPMTRSAATALRLRHYYQQISINNMQRLYKLYENDFKLFDYNLESLLGYDLG